MEDVEPSEEDALIDTEEDTEGDGVGFSVPEMLPVREALLLLEGDRAGERDVEADPPPAPPAVPDAVVVGVPESVLCEDTDRAGDGELEARESIVPRADADGDCEAEAHADCVAEPVPSGRVGVAHALMLIVCVAPPVKEALTLGEPEPEAAA
jgi:hypothetical protein